MKICRNCNLLYQDNIAFCGKCGNKLELYQQNATHDAELKQNSNEITHEENPNKNNYIFAVAALILVILGLLYSQVDNSKTSLSNTSTSGLKISENNAHKIDKISKDFQPIKILDGTLFVPTKGFEKLDIPKPNPLGGMALLGTVKKEVVNPKELNLYNIFVSFAKDETLKTMKPEEEETVLNNAFEFFWTGMKRNVKVATKQELITKEICTNIHGKKYIKFASISGNPDRPQHDSLHKGAIYIFEDTAYIIDVSAVKNFAKKYESEFDLILDSFSIGQNNSNIRISKIEHVKKGVITGTDVFMRTGPGKQYQSIGVFTRGETVTILDEQADWFKVKSYNNNKPVWVYSRYCAEDVNAEHKKYWVHVKKSALTLYLLDDKNNVIKAYDCNIGKNPGQKQKSGDMRTPTGTFYVDGIYNSSNWTRDYGDGRGEIKGLYGPWFISLNTDDISRGAWSGIGIHGTLKYDEMRQKNTEGSVCLQNQNVEDLKQYVGTGTKVVIEE